MKPKQVVASKNPSREITRRELRRLNRELAHFFHDKVIPEALRLPGIEPYRWFSIYYLAEQAIYFFLDYFSFSVTEGSRKNKKRSFGEDPR
jgi:hypothetical protein